MTASSVHEPLHVPVAIVGTGFSGLGLAIRLLQTGRDRGDFLLLERADDVGGTWRDNTYPGCACDVESALYSYSFVPPGEWTRQYSPGAEIQAYLRGCAERFDLRGRIRFGAEVLEAAWDAGARRWRISTSSGELTADVLVGATGGLSDGRIPELPGLASFAGRVFHSARWDHSLDLAGRSVAVVGTGASAIQFVPAIQPRVAQLHLFQRTPAWILPRHDRTWRGWERRAFPLLRRLIYARRELVAGAFRFPRLMKVLELWARWHLRRAIPDPALRAKLTPTYVMGCKRILVSDDFYPALRQPNVSLVTSPIREIRPGGVVTEDEREHAADTLIFGTGFEVSEPRFARRVRGSDGRTLAEAWAGSPRAHLGTTVAGFPNLFLLLGPNTGLGHSSVLLMIESQLTFVLKALAELRRRGEASTLEPRADAQAAYNRELDARMRGRVWVTEGCRSWYLDRAGRNSAIWPGSIARFRRRLARFRPSEFAWKGSPPR